MSRPLVSILTPFKNTAKYLPECLNSVLNQTFNNWELILLDDNSDDNSHDIVKSYAARDQRIKLFRNSGNGIIDALRLAFSKAEGDFISRMDSDDIMVDQKLEIMLDQLNSHGQGHIATGLVKYFNEKGVNDGYKRYEKWLNKLSRTGRNFTEIYKECVIPSPCWMLSKSDLIKCGAFNEDRYPEDYDLTFRFYKNGLKVIPTDHLLHHWRDYESRTSRTHKHYAQNYFLDIKLYYFLELDYDSNRTLTLWGAGFKGKKIAKKLVKRLVKFTWICNNPKKIGKRIYGVKLESFKKLASISNPQSIVTVANDEAQVEIRSYFLNRGMLPMSDYFFFC